LYLSSLNGSSSTKEIPIPQGRETDRALPRQKMREHRRTASLHLLAG
jgi:hypothetical protein